MKNFDEILKAEAAEQAAYEARTVIAADGLTIAEARVIFEEIQNRENWKLAVDHTFDGIGPAQRRKVYEAVAHFTGSKVEWTFLGGKRWRAQAAGYYAAVGA